MKVITRKKRAFRDLYSTGVLNSIVAVKGDNGWGVFGHWRDKDIAVFMESARGGTREWVDLDRLVGFCNDIGINVIEVRNKKTTGSK